MMSNELSNVPDETFSDELTTLNQNSSSSILHRSINIRYVSQEYVIRSKSRFNVLPLSVQRTAIIDCY
jgi:hypothetical protein